MAWSPPHKESDSTMTTFTNLYNHVIMLFEVLVLLGFHSLYNHSTRCHCAAFARCLQVQSLRTYNAHIRSLSSRTPCFDLFSAMIKIHLSSPPILGHCPCSVLQPVKTFVMWVKSPALASSTRYNTVSCPRLLCTPAPRSLTQNLFQVQHF